MNPVPKVVAWSGETGCVVRPDPVVERRLALFAASGKAGDGEPLFAALSHERQRALVMGRACGVCGLRLPTGTGFALLMYREPDPELRTLVLHEPITCRACLALPLQHCRRVRAAAAAGKLDALLVRGYSTDHLYLGPTIGGDEHAQEITRALEVAGASRAVGFVELIPEDYQHITIARVYAAAGLVVP